jgi:hypothetical protein
MSGFAGLSRLEDDSYYHTPRFFADATLSSPVLNLDIIRFRSALRECLSLTELKDLNPYHLDAYRIIKLLGPQMADNLTSLDPEDYPEFVAYYAIATVSAAEKFDQIKKSADKLYEDAVTGLDASINSPVSLIKEFKEIAYTTIPSPVYKYYNGFLIFRALITAVRKNLAAGSKVIQLISIRGVKYYGGKSFFFLPWNGTYVYLSFDQCLMFLDLLQSRYLVHLTAVIHKPSHHKTTLTGTLESIFEYQAAGLANYGNMGYEIIKSIEPISKAYLSEISDKMLVRPSDYTRMVQKAKDKEDSLRPVSLRGQNYVTDKLTAALEQLSDPWSVTQVFGLQKLMGHPLIDPIKGAKEAAAHAQEEDSTLLSNALRLRSGFCHLALQGYLTQNRKWPELHFDQQGSKLHRLFRAGYLELDNYSYPLEDWNGVSWTKIFDFDYVPNYLELMDDKAIAFYRSKMACAWTKEELGFDPGPIPTRRLLLEMLSREEISAREIVRRVVTGDIPIDWLIVALYPKEREMKTSPRMFSMLCFEIRLFFVLAEHNLAEGIFRLLPQQTMTNSGLAVLKRFEALTNPIQSDTLLRVFIEVDLTRWNLRWRELAVHIIGDDLDQMYGMTGVYTFAHTFFAQALIHVRVSGCPPPYISPNNNYPPESDLLWYNHLGGFEGICQKHWTIATLAMMYLAVVDYGLRFTLTGQGDNQVLVVWRRLRADEDKREALTLLYNVLMARIELEARRVNQIVKPEECLRSTSVVTYSKHVWVNGVYIPTTLKAHSRLFPVSATDMPTTLDNVGAIYSGAIGAAERSEMPLRSWYLANLLAMDYLEYTLRVGDIHGPALSKQMLSETIGSRYLPNGDYLRALVTLPSALGGLPVSTLTAFVYKGGADPLTAEIMSLKILSKSKLDGKIYRRMLGQLKDDSLYESSPNIMNLISDPYSVPFRRYRAPKEAVRQSTLDQILPTIRNQAVKEMINVSLGDFAQYLEEFFQTAEPVYPLPLHDLYAESPMGLTEEFKAKFTNTRSIQKIARGSGVDIGGDLMFHDVSAMLGVLDRLAKLAKADIYMPLPPAHEIALTLRSRWGKEVLGVTTIHPLDQSMGVNSPHDVSAFISIQSVSASKVLRTTRGPVAPYIGSRTREKRADYGIRLILNHPGAVAIKKLGLINSQLSGDNNTSEVIRSIAGYRTGDDLEYSQLLEEHVYGGTPAHRYDAIRGRPPAYLAQTPNVSTHIMLSSDSSGKYSGGEHDYPIVFQEFYLAGIWLAGLYSSYLPDTMVPSIWISLPDNLEPIPDKKVTCRDLRTRPNIPPSQNPLIYTPILYYRQTGNLLKSACLGESDVTPEAVTTLGWHNVAYAYFASYLDNHSRIQSATDIMYNFATQGEELDLLEVQRIGAKRLFMGASLAVAERARVQASRLHGRILPRYKEYTLVKKIINSVLSTYLRSLTHPLLRDDEFCKAHGLYLGAGKSGQKLLIDRCTSVLMAMTLKILEDPFHPVYSNPRLVTADSSSSSFSKLVATWMVFQISRVGEILPGHLRSALFIGCVNPLWTAVNERKGEEMVLAQLILLRLSLNEIGGGAALIISDAVERALQGKIFVSLRVSIPELIRLSRELPSNSGPVVPHITRIGNTQTHPTSIKSTIIGPSPIPCDEVGMEPSSSQAGQRVILDILRHAGVIYGFHGIAQDYWIPVLAKHNPGGKCLLVGTGAGAVGVAAIRTGSHNIIGIELLQDIPRVQQRFRTYIPPEIRVAGYDTRFSWSETVWAYGGDWRKPDVVQQSIHTDNPDLICIDVEKAGHRPTLALLIPLERLGWTGTVILKTYCTHEELISLLGHLHLTNPRAKIYLVDKFLAPVNRYLCVIPWDPSIKIRYCAAADYNIQSPPAYPLSVPGKYMNAMNFILTNVCGGFNSPSSPDTIEDQLNHMKALYKNIQGNQRGRLSDEEFQSLKAGLVILGCLSEIEPDQRLLWIARAVQMSKLTYRYRDYPMGVTQKIDLRIKMLLLKFVSRLCPSPNDYQLAYQALYDILVPT